MTRKKRKRRISTVGIRWQHSQRPPECCRTHLAISHSTPCFSCTTLDMAESRLGRAILLLSSRGFIGAPESVLDALIQAEQSDPWLAPEHQVHRHAEGRARHRLIHTLSRQDRESGEWRPA